MLKIGIIGMGFMGRMHYRCYQSLGTDVVKVAAICDIDPQLARGELASGWGNLGDNKPTQLPMHEIEGTTDYHKLLNIADLDAVDVCVPTPVHAEIACAAIEAGKHVLCEKPLGRTSKDAKLIENAAAKAQTLSMPAMCIRFWPAYAWLKAAVDEKRYGPVRAAHFTRLSSAPGRWFDDGEQSGGALLDLHIHDTDFIHYLFGKPAAVFSRGYPASSGKIDHVLTHYHYDNVPLVTAEGGWSMALGYPFKMAWTVNFENATADFDLSRPVEQQLMLYADGKGEGIVIPTTDGWYEEIAYFVDCVTKRRTPSVVTMSQARQSIEIVEAEQASIAAGKMITL